MMIHRPDPRPASGTRVGREPPFATADTIDGAYRLLKIRGLSSVEAGNVVGYLAGLRASETGWTVKEIKHLLAIRAFVARGAIEP